MGAASLASEAVTGGLDGGGGGGAGFELVSQKRRAMLAMEFVPDGSALLDDH